MLSHVRGLRREVAGDEARRPVLSAKAGKPWGKLSDNSPRQGANEEPEAHSTELLINFACILRVAEPIIIENARAGANHLFGVARLIVDQKSVPHQMSFDHAIFAKLRYSQVDGEILATIARWIGIEAAGLLESLASDQGRAAIADGVRAQHVA